MGRHTVDELERLGEAMATADVMTTGSAGRVAGSWKRWREFR